MVAELKLDDRMALPADGTAGALAGRVWRPDVADPSVVAVRPQGIFDISAEVPTMRDLCETADPAAALRAAEGERLCGLDELLANTPRERRDEGRPGCLRRSISRPSRRQASPSRSR